MASPSTTTMRCSNPKLDRALFVTGALAASTLRAITTTKRGRYVVYSAQLATKCWQQYVMTQTVYTRQQVISLIRLHEEYWQEETGRSTPTS